MKTFLSLSSKVVILLVLLTAIQDDLSAQRWKRTRYEVIAGVGPSFFLGEFGGSYRTGSHFLGDLDMQSTRYNFMIGARYKIQEKFAVKMNIIYGRVHGSDLYTTNEGRLPRGGTFSSPIFETSFQAEYSVLKERFGNRYTFQYMKKFKFSHVNTYLFLGVGSFFFNPNMTYTGKNTNVEKPYSKVNACFPMGIGFKYGINRRYCLGLEFGQRYTTTDYIDGWSDRSSKGRDAYGFILLNVTYKLKTARSGLPKF